MIVRFKIFDKLPPFLRDKYILTLIIFLLWLILLDSNNLINRYKEVRNLKKLKADREYYTIRIEEDKNKLRELKTDNKNLEKFAREQYRMKKPEEDLYIVLSPGENRKITKRNKR